MSKTKNRVGRKVMSFILAGVMLLAYYVPDRNVTKVRADGEIPSGFLTGITKSDDITDSIPEGWYIQLEKEDGEDDDEDGVAFYQKIADEYDEENSYSSDNPLQIKTKRQLAAFAKAVNEGKNFAGKFVQLTADIDLGGGGIKLSYDEEDNGDFTVRVEKDGTPHNLWVPIGSVGNPFRGTFDGDGRTVSGVVSTDTSPASESNGARLAGLFGSTYLACLTDVEVMGSSFAVFGGADSYAGLLCASAENSRIARCACSGVIAANSGSLGAGGMFGECCNGSSVGSCCCSVLVLSGGWAGGFCGRTSSGNGRLVEFADCEVRGLVAAFGGCCGGVVGAATALCLSRCFSVASMRGVAVSSGTNAVGGLVGWARSATYADFCFAAGDVDMRIGAGQTGYAGVLSGSAMLSRTHACYRASGAGLVVERDASFTGDPDMGKCTLGEPVDVSSLMGDVPASLPALCVDGGFDFDNVWRVVENDFPRLRAFKYTPICARPEGLTTMVGKALGDVALDNPATNTPGTWSWEPGQDVSVFESDGVQTFLATFEPSDMELYKTVHNIEVDVLVVGLPENLGSTCGNSLSSVPLPGDWAWDDGDEVLTAVGTHKFLATFTPANENYNALSVYLDVMVDKSDVDTDLFTCEVPEDLNYNAQPKKVAVEPKCDGVGRLSVKYMNSEGDISGDEPVQVGRYEVYVSVGEGDLYHATEEDVKVCEFEIVNDPDLDEDLDITEAPYVDEESNTYWYKDSMPIEIKAAGVDYKISTSPTDSFVNSIRLFDGDDDYPTEVYLLAPNGHISRAIPLPDFKWDNKPVVGEIKVEGNVWTRVLNVITFGLLFRDGQHATITTRGDANPTSGIKEQQYLLTDVSLIKDSSATDEEKAHALSVATGWKSFEGESLTIDLPEGKSIVYARFVDNVGHVTYVSSDGMVVYTEEEGKEIPSNPQGEVNSEVDKSRWGEPKEIDGIMHYIDADGKTSVEVPDELGIIWLKEESDGTSAWYGFDNRAGVFEPGSRAYVQWLSKGDSDFEELLAQIDPEVKTDVEGENMWIFRIGVIRPNGERYSNLEEAANFYVQIGDDWDKEDLQGYYVSEAQDESVETTFTNAIYPEGEDLFGVMKLNHFSPYLIIDKLTENDAKKTENAEQSSEIGTQQAENANESKTSDKVSGNSARSQNEDYVQEDQDEDLADYDDLIKALLDEIDGAEDLEKKKVPVKPTGDARSRTISTIGMLTLISAAYLLLRKKKLF